MIKENVEIIQSLIFFSGIKSNLHFSLPKGYDINKVRFWIKVSSVSLIF